MNDILIFLNCSIFPKLSLLAAFSILYFRAIPLNGSVLETTKSKAAFVLSNQTLY